MARKLQVAIYSFTLLLLITATSYAVCQLDGVTMDGGNIISCPAPIQQTILNNSSVPPTTAQADEINIPPGGGVNVPMTTVAINTSLGDDVVNVMGDVTSGDSSALVTVGGNDTVTVDGGNLTAGGNFGNALATFPGDDTVIVNSGNLIAGGNGDSIATGSGFDNITINGGFFSSDVSSGNDEDVVTVNGGTFEGAISSDSGNDQVILNGGDFTSSFAPALLGNDDDTLTINADIPMEGRIQCGQGFDTIIFAMTVPENRIDGFTSRIIQSNPDLGEIKINGFEYSWLSCEQLIPDLKAGPNIPSTVPTLSEWGLIAMAGVLGLISLMVIRRRQTA